MNRMNLSSIFDGLQTVFADLLKSLNRTLIVEDRYKLYLKGFSNTILIALGALVIGLILGLLVAYVRYIHKKFGTLKFLNGVCNVYVAVIRGTPVVLQLMIMAFIVLVFVSSDLLVAMIAFGFNSGAYVSEIFRGGLEGVDDGQYEAGRSLGLSFQKTLRFIVIPQAIKRSLPPLGNEFIALIKETSVVGYISIMDITFAANRIQSRTLEAFFPLIIAALMYLVLVYVLTFILRKIERRFAVSDRS